MPSFLLRSLWVVAGMCLIPLAVQAQDTDTTDQQLPEIAPREIEIRGELQVSFPSLERQPLSGFASPPKIPSVPPDHTPYAESYKQALADLPESLPAPEATTQTVSETAPSDNGFLQVGGGRYASRFAEGRYLLDLTPDQSLSFHADYYGQEGFTPFPDANDDLDTPSDQVDGSVRFESRHDGFAIRTTAHGQADSYSLYGLPILATNSTLSVPQRTRRSGGLNGQLHTFGSIDSRLRIGYDRTTYDTESSPSTSSTETFNEGRFQLDGRLRVSLANRETQFDLAVDRATYGGDVSSSAGFSLDGGGHIQLFTTDRLTVEGGVRALSYNAPDDPTLSDPGSVGATYILPEARATFALTSGLTLMAENQPTLQSDGLTGLYGENPYAEHAPSVRPTVYTTNAEVGLHTTLGPVRLQSNAEFRYAPSYRFFFSPLTSGTLDNVSPQVGYGSARILRGGGQLALQGIDGVEASVGVYLQEGTLTGPDTDIPYFAPFVTNAMFSVSFLDQKGLLQTSGTVEGARPIAPGSDREVDAYVSFDVEGSYRITSLLDVVLSIRNLSPSAPERWARYPQPPTVLSGGFRIHW